MTDSTAKTQPPVFYTRDVPEYRGSKVSLWPNDRASEGAKPAQFTGEIGNTRVQLWEASGGNTPFYNIKAKGEDGALVQMGTANAFVNSRGYNALSISLRFPSEDAANAAKVKMDLKEAVKPYAKNGETSYFVNVYADVSRRSVEANPEEFKRLGFKTEFEPAAAKQAT